jgi:hypothetical protein
VNDLRHFSRGSDPFSVAQFDVVAYTHTFDPVTGWQQAVVSRVNSTLLPFINSLNMNQRIFVLQ